jgi:hypothetical protein
MLTPPTPFTTITTYPGNRKDSPATSIQIHPLPWGSEPPPPHSLNPLDLRRLATRKIEREPLDLPSLR